MYIHYKFWYNTILFSSIETEVNLCHETTYWSIQNNIEESVLANTHNITQDHFDNQQIYIMYCKNTSQKVSMKLFTQEILFFYLSFHRLKRNP